MACSATDQLDTPRLGACDIGAIEFYPVVNDLVAVGNVSTDFDASPVPGGPAGTFRITADLTNTSNQAIVNPFVEVVELTGGNLLLNADGGAGGVGARLTPPGGVTTPFQSGASSTFEFLIGLQQQEPFTFFVNVLGAPRTSSSSVSVRRESQSQGFSTEVGKEVGTGLDLKISVDLTSFATRISRNTRRFALNVIVCH